MQADEFTTLSGDRLFVPGQNDLPLLLSVGLLSQPAGGIMSTGLCAFPLTLLHQQYLGEKMSIHTLSCFTDTGVDFLGTLGSTGSYAYPGREQCKRMAQVAKAHVGSIPMVVGVGTIAISEVLYLVEGAQQIGTDTLLLPMVSYQPLSAEEIFASYEEACRYVSVPVCLYDDPRTTHVVLTDKLQGRITALPAITSIKVPGLSKSRASERVATLRRYLPARVTLGVGSDSLTTAGLQTGCQVWCSVCGGLLPQLSGALVRAICSGDAARVTALDAQLVSL